MFARRLIILYGFICLMLVVLAGRLFHLQVLCADRDYAGQARSRLFRQEEVAPIRGLVVDRHGEALAMDRPTTDLVIHYQLLQEPESWLDSVHELTGAPREHLLASAQSTINRVQRIRERVPARYRWIREETIAHPVVRNVSLERVVPRVEANPERYPGIEIRVQQSRRYLYGTLASHLLGFVGELQSGETPPQRADEIMPEKDYQPGETVGKGGLEMQYDSWLQGEPGMRLYRINLEQGGSEIVAEQPAKPGNTVWLTLDSKTQRAAEEALEGLIGAVVVMDARSGAVRAMASSPGFDVNELRENYSELASDRENRPLLNRAIQDPVPLGSVMKISGAVAALEEGVINEHTTLNCQGVYRLGSHEFACLGRYAHGDLTVKGALEHSCNVFFFRVARMMDGDVMAAWARDLGLGVKSGIDLPFEWSGRVPDSTWTRENRGRGWFPGDSLNLSIGQGDTLVTPLQVAVMMAAIANGGYAPRPHLLGAVRDGEGRLVYDGGMNNIERRLNISQNTLRIVRDASRAVVTTGTARRIEGLKELGVAGKTGTAQTGRSNENHAWFAGYAPYDNPEVSFAVVIHRTSDHGGTVSGPIAAKTLSAYFDVDYGIEAARGDRQ